MSSDSEVDFPRRILRRAGVVPSLAEISARRRDPQGQRISVTGQARWRPDGVLISLLGIIKHLTKVQWRWIDGVMLGKETSRSDVEFTPGPEFTVAAALAGYRARADHR
jgi:hypothetical protein